MENTDSEFLDNFAFPNQIIQMAEELEGQLIKQIITTLNLEDMEPSDIDADDMLFGDDGLGLDSIDALELIVLMNKEYGLQVADPEEGKKIFESVKTMAGHIRANT